LQAYFPECSRPGPQLFSFRDPELLSKAWKHPLFTHLKSKWMYISFSDTKEDGLGGAAQGIIPVQDAQGNMLGGATSSSSELLGQVGQVRQETKIVRNEMTKLEQHFEKMMEAVEKNTEQVAQLAKNKQLQGNGARQNRDLQSVYSDTSALSTHLSRINDLLTKNQEQVEGMSKKQADNQEQFRTALQDFASRQTNDYLDMSHLSSHLDRIQTMMETSLKDQTETAQEVAKHQSQAPKIDFSPLTDRLGKLQESVEQNSTVMKALLDDQRRRETTAREPKPQSIDVLPLTQHLQKMQTSIEQQSEHMKALVGYASGELQETGTAPTGDSGERSLAPLGEHLEQIYNAIEEGNERLKGLPKMDDHLDKIHVSTERNADQMQQLLHKHDDLQSAFQAASEPTDMTPLAEKLDGVNEHLEVLREWTEFDSDQLKELVASAKATRDAVEEAGNKSDVRSVTQKLAQLLESENAIREAMEAGRSIDLEPLSEKFDIINDHLEQLRLLLEAQQEAEEAKDPSKEIDFTPVTDCLSRIHDSLEKQAEKHGTGDPKFIMSALTSHLSKIQAITETNTQRIKSMREGQSASQEKMNVAVSQTADHVRELTELQERNDERLDATNCQVRELMAGQREMVSAVRQLATSITAQQKGECDHVVIPPPRKVGRKVVGFVYDAKDMPV